MVQIFCYRQPSHVSPASPSQHQLTHLLLTIPKTPKQHFLIYHTTAYSEKSDTKRVTLTVKHSFHGAFPGSSLPNFKSFDSLLKLEIC